MTAAEINRGLAEALGWEYDEEYCEAFKYLRNGSSRMHSPFSPTTNSNHLREHIFPEIIRRKLWSRFISEVESSWTMAPDDVDSVGTFNRYLLCCDPAVLAAAVLKVLKEGA